MEGKDFRFSTLIRPMKAAAIPTIMTRIPEAEKRNKRESGTYTRKAKLFQEYTEMARKVFHVIITSGLASLEM